MLESIHALREKMESEEAGTRLAQHEAEAIRNRLQKRLEEIERERTAVLEAAREEAQEELQALRDELRRARQGIRDAASLNALKKVGKEIEDIEAEQVEPIAPRMKVGTDNQQKKKVQQTRRALQVGDTVQVKSLGTRGEVLELGKKDVLIVIGRLQMRAAYEDLEFKGRPVQEEPEESSIGVTAAPSPGMELDLRGRRVEDGVSETERYLDAAFLARLPWVRIIHGKGTGKLREGVRQILTRNPHVASWEEGKDGEGGAGVTVAKLVEHD